jgi:hypothetical protein
MNDKRVETSFRICFGEREGDFSSWKRTCWSGELVDAFQSPPTRGATRSLRSFVRNVSSVGLREPKEESVEYRCEREYGGGVELVEPALTGRGTAA